MSLPWKTTKIRPCFGFTPKTGCSIPQNGGFVFTWVVLICAMLCKYFFPFHSRGDHANIEQPFHQPGPGCVSPKDVGTLRVLNGHLLEQRVLRSEGHGHHGLPPGRQRHDSLHVDTWSAVSPNLYGPPRRDVASLAPQPTLRWDPSHPFPSSAPWTSG